MGNYAIAKLLWSIGFKIQEVEASANLHFNNLNSDHSETLLVIKGGAYYYLENKKQKKRLIKLSNYLSLIIICSPL